MTMETSDTKKADWNNVAGASAQAEAEAKHPPRRFEELLPVKLTEKELADRAKKAAAARRRVAEFEAQKSAAASHWKAKIELAENERDELLDAIDSGVEEREIEVVEEFIFRTGTVMVTRTDTGEIVRERALTASERQPNLPGTDDDSDEPQMSLDDVEPAPADDEDELDPSDDETVIRDPEIVLGAEAQAPERRVIRRRKKGGSS